MPANLFFFFSLFFLLGIILKYYFNFWLIFVFISLVFFRRLFLVLLFSLAFLLGGGYLIFFQLIQKQTADNKIYLIKEFPSTNYYHKYLGKFKGENYFVYLPYYYNKLFPKDSLIAQFDIQGNRIFIKELKEVKHSIYTPFYQLRNYINQLIDKNYSLVSSEIISGILYGREINDKELRENFRHSGLSHITAMSGYNLIVISSAVHRLFNSLAFNFFLINFLSIIFILIFVVLTGFQSSVIRAGIMMIVFIFSKLIGKPALQRNVLIFTALIISLFDPLALVNDLGFQLSILATVGLVYWEEYFRKILKFKFLSEVISAQILVIPLLWYKFGEFNLFSFFNNALVVSIIPYLMLIGFFSLFLVYFYPVNQIINLPFELFGLIINFLAKLPKLYLPMPLVFTLAIYFLIFFYMIKINKNERLDFNFSFN